MPMLWSQSNRAKVLKSTLLVDMKASEVGFYDEMGSIFVTDIVRVVGDN